MHVMPQNCWLQYTLYIWQDYTFYKINIQFCSTYIQAKITEQEENTIFSKRQQCSYGNGGTLNVPSIMILSTLITRINQRQIIWPKNFRATSECSLGNPIFENFIGQKRIRTGSKWIPVSPSEIQHHDSVVSRINQRLNLYGRSWRS